MVNLSYTSRRPENPAVERRTDHDGDGGFQQFEGQIMIRPESHAIMEFRCHDGSVCEHNF